MIKKVKTNSVEIRINAKAAGDYGFMRIGGMERTPEQEYQECEKMLAEIKRHVEGIGWSHISQSEIYQTDDGEEHETLYEALTHLFDEEDALPNYRYSYKKDTDQYGSAGTTNDFKEIILKAYSTPWNFKVTGTMLTEVQQLFLNNVLTASLAEKSEVAP